MAVSSIMNRNLTVIMLSVIAVLACIPAMSAQKYRNDHVLNRPYSDMRRWHLGFSVGLHTQDLQFANNGFVTEDGESWFVEQPSFSPGFCVNGLFDLRLNDYFNLRVSPGLYFGNRDIRFRDAVSGQEERQNLKSTFIVLPVDIKFSAQRYRNLRPYMVGGVMPAFDVAKKRRDFLQLNTTDFYLTIGFGCDFYLPYFKLIPEIKFCFGLSDVLRHDRPDLDDDPTQMKYTNSIKKATSQMVVLTFYFE